MKVEEALDIAGDIVGTNNRTKEADAAVVLYQEVRALRKLLEIRTPISDSSTEEDIPFFERQYPTREDMRREIRRLTELTKTSPSMPKCQNCGVMLVGDSCPNGQCANGNTVKREGEKCQASPCDLIRAKNEERDWCCKVIMDCMGSAYPDRAVSIIDLIHGKVPKL